MVIDTNVLLAVALDEPEKTPLIRATQGVELISPNVLPYEVGNALSALVKRKVIKAAQAMAAWDVIGNIRIGLLEVEIRAALELAVRHGIYAYDGYFLQSAIQSGCPLLTLDRRMRRVAEELEVKIVEPI
jgi:predicted nucleic acid-binding protein